MPVTSHKEWCETLLVNQRGSIYTTIMELGPKNHNGDGLLGPNSMMVVYMDPLGNLSQTPKAQAFASTLEKTQNKTNFT